MTWIDSKEAAKLMCITLQAVNKAAREGKYGDKVRYIKGRGGSGRILQVALEALPEEAQIKWQSDKENIYTQLSLPLDSFSVKKRTESASKLMIINEYKEFLEKNVSSKYESKNPLKQFVDAWNTIHPEQMTSIRSLYRWISKLEKVGVEGLIDKRGAWNKGISSIPEEVWRLFKYYYLDENKPSVKSCYDRVHVTAIEKGINLPSVSAFERMAKNIPKPVLVRWRDGAKAFEDLCMPYISRDYTSFKSNQIWVTDHHIFDQLVIGPGNRLVRPWGTYFEDMRSRLMVASYVRCKEPNADVVLACFAKGVDGFGIPSEIVLDNGKDYKALDIFNTEEKNRVNSLAKQLDIITHYALPYNAKAKPIERFFRTFEEQFGKLWQSYCGNNPNNRPRRLKNLNRDQYPTLEEWKEIHDMYIDKNYNMAPHEGNGMDDKSPYEVYHENLAEKRVAPKEVLRLFMMRTTRAIKVQRNGIRLFDKYYWSPELIEYQGRQVYARYNPDSIDMLYIYSSSDDIFLCEAYNNELLPLQYKV
ncbi:MAG: Mu transposase C-terminal domain-containing protein [Bacillota bacterium]